VETAQGAPTPPNGRSLSNLSLQSLCSVELSDSSCEEDDATSAEIQQPTKEVAGCLMMEPANNTLGFSALVGGNPI